MQMNLKKYWLMLAFAVWAIAFVPLSAAAQTQYTEISGTLRVGRVILPNTSVTVINVRRTFSRTSMTDSNGFYKFTMLPLDRYDIRASVNGFAQRTIKIIAGIGGRKIFDIDLEDDIGLGTIIGEVTDKKDKPIPTVKLMLAEKANKENKLEITVDDEGKFDIPELAQGRYILSFTAEGFAPLEKEFNLRSGQKKVEVELKPLKNNK